jgi:hypothetical protein
LLLEHMAMLDPISPQMRLERQGGLITNFGFVPAMCIPIGVRLADASPEFAAARRSVRPCAGGRFGSVGDGSRHAITRSTDY